MKMSGVHLLLLNIVVRIGRKQSGHFMLASSSFEWRLTRRIVVIRLLTTSISRTFWIFAASQLQT